MTPFRFFFDYAVIARSGKGSPSKHRQLRCPPPAATRQSLPPEGQAELTADVGRERAVLCLQALGVEVAEGVFEAADPGADGGERGTAAGGGGVRGRWSRQGARLPRQRRQLLQRSGELGHGFLLQRRIGARGSTRGRAPFPGDAED